MKLQFRFPRIKLVSCFSCLLAATSLQAAVTIGSNAGAPTEPLSTWYASPASAWTQALPIGNGRLAGMI